MRTKVAICIKKKETEIFWGYEREIVANGSIVGFVGILLAARIDFHGVIAEQRALLVEASTRKGCAETLKKSSKNDSRDLKRRRGYDCSKRVDSAWKMLGYMANDTRDFWLTQSHPTHAQNTSFESPTVPANCFLSRSADCGSDINKSSFK